MRHLLFVYVAYNCLKDNRLSYLRVFAQYESYTHLESALIMGESGTEDKPVVGGDGLVISIKSIRSDIFTLRAQRANGYMELILTRNLPLKGVIYLNSGTHQNLR